MALVPADQPLPASSREETQRRRKVAQLYEDVIGRVVEGLREDCKAEGMDENILDDFKKVRGLILCIPFSPTLRSLLSLFI